jgi:hypothetical protein
MQRNEGLWDVKSPITAFMLLLLASLVSFVGSTPAALAFNCSTNVRTWAAFHWTRTAWDVDGVRAPVEMRTDGGLCDNDVGWQKNFSATWIAIEENAGSGINQAGILHSELPDGTKQWCRFYAGGIGAAQRYSCTYDPNGTFIFYTIHTYNSGQNYQISDCGTSGGYLSCTPKYGADSVYDEPLSATDAETALGCDIHIMGSNTNQQNVGESNWFVQGLDGSGTWASRSWGNQGVFNIFGASGCDTYYKLSEVNSGEIMKFYDTRNSS